MGVHRHSLGYVITEAKTTRPLVLVGFNFGADPDFLAPSHHMQLGLSVLPRPPFLDCVLDNSCPLGKVYLLTTPLVLLLLLDASSVGANPGLSNENRVLTVSATPTSQLSQPLSLNDSRCALVERV
jgi:hypothetical protein